MAKNRKGGKGVFPFGTNIRNVSGNAPASFRTAGMTGSFMRRRHCGSHRGNPKNFQIH